MRRRTRHFDNLDAAESIFFLRQLEELETQLYNVKHVELQARELIPVDNRPNPTARRIVYRQYDHFGQAKIISNYADDLPRVNVKGLEFTAVVKSIGISYGFSLIEVRSAAAESAGGALDTMDAFAARRGIEETIDAIASSGDSATGLIGFLGIANANSYTPANSAANSTTPWISGLKTADEILADMNGATNLIVTNTKNVEKPDTMLLPLAQYQFVVTKRVSTVSDTTILPFFLNTNPYIRQVAPWPLLSTAGSGSTTRMVVYRRDPMAVRLRITQEFEQLPVQERNLEFIINCHARLAGVIAQYPMTMCYADAI